MYREEFKVFNEIGNRLNALFFQDKPPLDNVAVLLAAHSLFSGLCPSSMPPRGSPGATIPIWCASHLPGTALSRTI